jgi:hypothetical protein
MPAGQLGTKVAERMGFEEVALVYFPQFLCGFGEAVDVSVVNLGVNCGKI